ncbi:alpha/beta hydrolase [Corynebacterium sp. UBA2622]|uniref:alpha/beta hydrolase n=1 Tax=Corynebacterium sp. UBA2622 TaxID=1946393 RepID=UPI0025C1AB16|nr:alpha/beta hydrolase [Corynebacterium sp. UBA2622]
MTATYTPRLRPAELARAAELVGAASSLVGARGADARGAASAIAGTGFEGPAADAGLARLTGFGVILLSRGELLANAARILSAAGAAQAELDRFADLLVHVPHTQAIEWLNMLSWLLDTTAARALRTALIGSDDGGFEELVHRPLEPLADIHASHLATVPAATAQVVEAAGGLILESGAGRTTVIVGDVTDPERVTTLVAGVSTGKPGKLSGEVEKALRIAEATGGAVVVWEGYRPPPDVPGGLNPVAAREGGERLSAFQMALEERFPDARKSVVAHSYGTVVATRAATEAGLWADDVWLLGSPGVPAHSACDYRLHGDNPQVYVVDGDSDPVTLLRRGGRAVHGTSPSDPSFGAAVVGGVEGGHSAYFTDPDWLRAIGEPPGGSNGCTNGKGT